MLSRKLLVAMSLMTIMWVSISASFFFLYASSPKSFTEEILHVSIREEISDRTENFIRNVVSVANYRQSRLIVISLDTPGGYVSNVESIMSIFDESKVPVMIFVEPFRAVSGGTYMLMAAHIAAMKTSSIIGSCQPVDATGVPITESKYINYLTELMRNHAWLHSRNETAAEYFVKKNLNLNGEQAFHSKVSDLIADGLQDLLSKLTGYTLIKYNDEGVLRFILVTKAEVGEYQVVQSWDFSNISKAAIQKFESAIELLYLPSLLLEFPIVLIFPPALLIPYIYPVLIVPLLSLTVNPSPEIVIALFSGINGVVGVCCIFLMLSRKTKES